LTDHFVLVVNGSSAFEEVPDDVSVALGCGAL
jgi:hypothetical protein